MKHLIYQVTNEINGKIYIGAHTGNVDDNYMGSGKGLVAAIRKYGKGNFTKTILYECDTIEEMFSKERELVSSDFVNRHDTYNRVVGGSRNGGYAFDEQAKRRRISESRRGKPAWNKGKKMNYSVESLQKMSRRGSKLTDETRLKMCIGQKNRRLREATK